MNINNTNNNIEDNLSNKSCYSNCSKLINDEIKSNKSLSSYETISEQYLRINIEKNKKVEFNKFINNNKSNSNYNNIYLSNESNQIINNDNNTNKINIFNKNYTLNKNYECGTNMFFSLKSNNNIEYIGKNECYYKLGRKLDKSRLKRVIKTKKIIKKNKSNIEDELLINNNNKDNEYNSNYILRNENKNKEITNLKRKKRKRNNFKKSYTLFSYRKISN